MDPRRRHLRAPDPGALLATTHAVAGGTRVRLRLTRPSDAAAVAAFLETLPPPSPSGAEAVRAFTFYDARSELVLAATAPVDGRERIIGLAVCSRIATTEPALSLFVAGDERGEAAGRLLSAAVASIADHRRRGERHRAA